MLLSPFLVMASATFFRDDGRAANGQTYSHNLRRYGAVCASNRYALGTVLVLTGPGGHRVRVTICDRVGHGTDYDVDPRTFRQLVGPLRKGRGRVRARLVRRAHKPDPHKPDPHKARRGGRVR